MNHFKIITLCLGNYFVKHHRWGTPKLRLVWLDEKGTRIYWSTPKNSKAKPRGHLEVSKIVCIKDGLVKARKIADISRQNNIFSIVTKS